MSFLKWQTKEWEKERWSEEGEREGDKVIFIMFPFGFVNCGSRVRNVTHNQKRKNCTTTIKN